MFLNRNSQSTSLSDLGSTLLVVLSTVTKKKIMITPCLVPTGIEFEVTNLEVNESEREIK